MDDAVVVKVLECDNNFGNVELGQIQRASAVLVSDRGLRLLVFPGQFHMRSRSAWA